MHSAELTIGRTFGVTLGPDEDFLPSLAAFCDHHGVRQGYIPMFLAAFKDIDLVGSCQKLENPKAPVWSTVNLTNVEAIGVGTIASNDGEGRVQPHVHVTVGEKARSATAYTSHLVAAQVQFLVEMIVVEVTSPRMTRLPDARLFDIPLLHFG